MLVHQTALEIMLLPMRKENFQVLSCICGTLLNGWWENTWLVCEWTVLNSSIFTSFICFVLFSAFFLFFETTYTIRVFAVFRLNYSMYWNDNLTERNKNLKNLESSFSFLFGDICLVAHRNVVNYGTWHVFKPFFGSSVVTCPPACSTIWL